MQQAIPYKSWLPLYTNNKPLISPSQLISHHSNGGVVAAQEVLKGSRNISEMVQENAIIVFARRGCCMSHVAKRLLLGLGVNPAVYEIDEADEISVLEELEMIGNDIGGKGNNKKKVQFPALVIGGKLFGGLDTLMATHISDTDPTILTMLLPDEVPGLEILQDGDWVPVKPIPNTLIVHVGDVLQGLSNCRYKSLLHRVIVNSEKERLSIASYCYPSNDTQMGPPKELIDDDHPLIYKDYTYEEFYTTMWKQRLPDATRLDSFKVSAA